jgi:hypothetical protein
LSEHESKKNELILASSSPDIYHGFTNNIGMRRATYNRYGLFLERDHRAATISVRRVLNDEGCQAVGRTNDRCAKHRELDRPNSYYKKMFIYGCSRQLYRSIMESKPLTTP